MNEDQIIGEGRNLLGKGERAIGEVVGSERLEADGLLEQAKGAVQHGYGRAKEAVTDLVEEVPKALSHGAERARDIGHRGEEAIVRRLGDNGPIYVLAGAVAVLALGVFALARR